MIDASGALKVMDFGIARDLGSGDKTAAISMGTPAYMSPELLNGGALSRPLSDIYSAGVMFYELLTGKRPFNNASLHERLNKPVSRVSEILLDISSDLDNAVYRCMQVQPERRFHSVEEMIAAFSKRAPARGPAAGTLSGLFLEDPAPLEDALLAFMRVVERVAAIHVGGGRPALLPLGIRWSGGVAEVQTVSAATGQQQTQAVNCKYASAEEFQESSPTGERGIASDAYVLGFIFYEMLLGQREFPGTVRRMLHQRRRPAVA